MKKENISMNSISRNSLNLILNSSSMRIIWSIIILSVIIAIFSDDFLRISNITSILRSSSIFGIMAIGGFLVILNGGIDLSVGSIYGLSGTICALCLHNEMNILSAILITLCFCTMVGAFNGALVGYIKLAPFIATLGTLNLIRSIIFILTNAQPVRIENKVLSIIGKEDIFKFPIIFIILIFIGILLSFILKNTILGKRLYAIGGDENSARVIGINVKGYKMLSYILASLLYAIAGIVGTGKIMSSYPLAGNGYEFEVIGAVIIGGASLSGGIGNILGVVLGAIFLGILKNGIVLLGISRYWQQSITGTIIIGVIVISKLLSKNKA